MTKIKWLWARLQHDELHIKGSLVNTDCVKLIPVTRMQVLSAIAKLNRAHQAADTMDDVQKLASWRRHIFAQAYIHNLSNEIVRYPRLKAYKNDTKLATK